MLPGDAVLVSVNDHLVEPADLWTSRLARARAGAGPRVMVDGDGAEAWVIGSEVLTVPQLSVLASGRGPGRALRTADFHRAVHDPTARLAAMDTDGVSVQTLLPHVVGFAGERLRFLGDAGLWAACAAAYNDFLLGSFCAAAPRRLVGVAILPFGDPEAAAAELTRAAALGARAFSFPHAPAQLGLPGFADPCWAPVFAAAEDTGLPMFVHVGSSGGPASIQGLQVAGTLLTVTAFDVLAAGVDLVFSHVFSRHPDLRVVLLEGSIGCLPAVTERIEFFCRQRPEVWDPPVGAVPPTAAAEQFRAQTLASFIDDPVGIRLRHDIGVERILWQCDFPHADSPWPHSRTRLAELLADTPEADARAIAGGNAARLLGLTTPDEP